MRNLKRLSLFVSLLAVGCESTPITMRSIQSRCYRTKIYPVRRQVPASFWPGKFTGWGNEGVTHLYISAGATDVSTSANDTSRAATPSRQPRPSDQTWADDRLDKAILIYALAGLCLLTSVGLLCKYVVCGHRVTALTRSPGSGVTCARSRSRVDSELAADSSMVLVFSSDITRER